MTDEATRREVFEAGQSKRREVLGDAHVERSLASATEFSRPIQELVTQYCWGEVWTRDGLPPRERSMINIAMLTALNRNHELSVHIKGAVNNGLRPEEIQEVLLQTAIYVGVPAALESFRVAEATLKDLGVDV